jgi:hypothetical protein
MGTKEFCILFLVLCCGTEAVLQLRRISADFLRPVGIDYHPPTDGIILTHNHPNGIGGNFRRVDFSGREYEFSTVSGLQEEV